MHGHPSPSLHMRHHKPSVISQAVGPPEIKRKQVGVSRRRSEKIYSYHSIAPRVCEARSKSYISIALQRLATRHQLFLVFKSKISAEGASTTRYFQRLPVNSQPLNLLACRLHGGQILFGQPLTVALFGTQKWGTRDESNVLFLFSRLNPVLVLPYQQRLGRSENVRCRNSKV